MSMLSRRGAGPDQLLLPASPVFIWVSLFTSTRPRDKEAARTTKDKLTMLASASVAC